jgi:hypothetical protein
MIGSVFFIFNRLVEIVFLIPIIGMLVCPHHVVNQSDQQLFDVSQSYPLKDATNKQSLNRPTSSMAT